MRCLLAGASGSGKTNVLLTILLHKIPLQNIYLCTRTIQQEKYQFLELLIEAYNENEKNWKERIQFFKVTPDTLQPPSKILTNSILIFDDCLADKQNVISSHFYYSRHQGNSLYYLSQSYTKIPKNSGIRENFNYFILFKMDSINLRQIYTEHISDLNSFEQFKAICTMCWNHARFSFLSIDPDNNNPKCRYTLNFDTSIDVTSFTK